MAAEARRGPWIAAILAAAAGLWVLWRVYDALFPVFLGFALAYALDPAADWLEKRRVPRWAAAGLILAGLTGLLALAFALAAPKIVSEAADFLRHLPGYLETALGRAEAFLAGYGVALPRAREELIARLRDWLSGFSLSSLSPVGMLAGRFFSGIAGALTTVLNLIVAPVVFFYFLRDIDKVKRLLFRLIPPRHQETALRRLDEADRVFSGYLRGQISVALLLAALYSIGLSLTGIRFAVVIGILAGLLNILPYVGVATGLSLSLVMAAVDFTGWGTFAAVLAVFGLCQALEGLVITPKIVGDKVGLLPVETIVALIVGAELGGLTGMVVAIPAAGCLKAYARDAAEAWRASGTYKR